MLRAMGPGDRKALREGGVSHARRRWLQAQNRDRSHAPTLDGGTDRPGPEARSIPNARTDLQTVAFSPHLLTKELIGDPLTTKP